MVLTFRERFGDTMTLSILRRTRTIPQRDVYNVDVVPETFAAADVEDSPCPVCGNELYRPQFRLPDFSKSILSCKVCGTGRMSPLPTADELRSYYPTDYYGSQGQKFESLIERFLEVVASRQARMISRAIPSGGRVLDVGCGRGMLLKRLADQGCEVHGTELHEAAALGADPRINLHICPSLEAAEFEDEKFDAIVIWHVLEHLPDPRKAVKEMQRILRPGGKLFVAVPNFGSVQARVFGHSWFHLDPPRHLFHFTASGLRQLLKDSGFAISSTHHFSLRQNPFGWIQSALNRIPGTVRNALYTDLHNCSARSGGRWQRLAYYVGMPLGVVASVLAAGLRSGATLHVVAQKDSTPLLARSVTEDDHRITRDESVEVHLVN